MISADQKQEFVENGYLAVQGLLDVGADIDCFRDAYVGYLDTLAEIVMNETNPDLRAAYSEGFLAERFATLLGCSGGRVLQHIDPSLSVFDPGYQRWKELPSAQRPELFQLMRNERLLDSLECFLGSEISISPIYHFNLKLAERHLKLAEDRAAAGQNVPHPLWDFHVGTTGWHTDAAYGLPDSHSSRTINAWIPITSATFENGCLLVAPGSHRMKPEREIAKHVTAVALVAAPGDVIFLDNNILHASLPNRSADDIRWAFSFRYLRTGEPSGRPFLPGFVARSRLSPERELRDPQLWSNMWRAALDFLSMNPIPHHAQELGVAEAEAITAYWRAAVPNYTDWLRLGEK
jgi:phytanoyl-CoA hydroxylase